MPPKSGLSAQIGYGLETTPGTAVTPTRFLPFVSESITTERERLESEGIIAGRRLLTSEQYNGGPVAPGGDVQHELLRQGTALLWRCMLGANATTGSGPYTHTATVADLADDSLTVQVGRPGVGGTVHPFTYAGMMVGSWEVACSQGEYATLGLTFIGMSETTATALASATYGTGAAQAFKFNHGTVSLGGSTVKVKSATVSGDNSLADDRWFLGQTNRDQPIEQSLREITGSIETEFADLTQYNHFVAGDELALVLALTAGADSCTITANVRYDGETPQVGGREILTQNLPFKVVANGTDAAAFTAVTINGNSTAT